MKKLLYLLLSIYLVGCASIKSPLDVSATGDGKYWILNSPLKYEVNGMNYEVPRGFVTDFASIPRVFWVAFPPCAKYTPAAVVHDYLYWIQSDECNQECADKILLSAMENSNVSWAERKAIYSAVRIAGKEAWQDNKELKKNGTKRLLPLDFVRDDPLETWEQMEKRLLANPKRNSN